MVAWSLVGRDGAAQQGSQQPLVRVQDVGRGVQVARQVRPMTHDGQLLEHHGLQVDGRGMAICAHDGDGAGRLHQLGRRPATGGAAAASKTTEASRPWVRLMTSATG